MVILTSFAPPTEGVRVEQPNTTAHVGNTRFGNGTLYIADSRVSWVGSSGRGFSLEYPAISLHAVSRDPRLHPDECLYLMIEGDLRGATLSDPNDGRMPPPTATGQEEAEEDDEQSPEDDATAMTEIRFVPEDKGVLDALFHAMSECQTLHPDPEDDADDSSQDDDEEYGDAEIVEDVPEVSTTLNGITGLNLGNGVGGDDDSSTPDTPMDTSQFDDADDD